MPRLKNVTLDELEALVDKGFDVSQGAHDCAARAGQGYVDELAEPFKLAVGFLAISRACADLSMVLLQKAALGEQQRELERKRKERNHGKEQT